MMIYAITFTYKDFDDDLCNEVYMLLAICTGLGALIGTVLQIAKGKHRKVIRK